MEAVQTTANPPSFKSVWEDIQETEQTEEAQLKEEIAKEKKRLWNKWVGESLDFGDIADYMLLPFLMKKFYKMGFNFFEGRPNYCIIDNSDEFDRIVISADFMMRNDDKEMLVILKKEPTIEDVQEHIKHLEKMRKYTDLHGDSGLKSGRTFLGAVAGVVITDNVKEYILKQGFFVIEPSGETFNIIPPNNKPKEW